MRGISLAGALAIALASSQLTPTIAAAASWPAGWRPATAQDVARQVARLHLDAGSRPPPDQAMQVKADFNGDGRPDEAALLIDERAGRFALFARMAGAPRAIRLSTFSRLGGLWDHGISVGKPGDYATACARGLGGDGPCRPKVQARWPVIEFEHYEASLQIIFWNGHTFVHEWLSD